MKNILLIDDNKLNLETFAEILKISGYCVTSASSGESGLKKVKDHSPDLILCDIRMEGIDGFELKEKINALHEQNGREIPFIFLTACSAPHEIKRAKELDASAYFVHPVAISVLLETIENFCFSHVSF